MEEVLQNLIHTTTQTLGYHSNTEYCEKCGEKVFVEKELLGRVRKVPVICSCRKKELEEQKKREEALEKANRLQRLKKYSLMDEKFSECTFENWIAEEGDGKLYKLGINYCDRWQEVKKKNMGLLIWGKPGNGKSYLSFCIANRLLESLVPVIAISSNGLLDKIKETYNYYGKEGEVEVINSIKNASLLVLDDLGAENTTTWAKEKIYKIIDSRYRDNKPLIITTNLTPKQLKEKMIGEDGVARTYDRIIEMCQPVEVKGESKRLKKASAKTKLLKELIN